MAKVRMYVRVAKDGYKYKVDAGSKSNTAPLHKGSYDKTYLPTVAFAVDLNLPDELFSKAERVIAEINVALKDVVVAAEIGMPSAEDKKRK